MAPRPRCVVPRMRWHASSFERLPMKFSLVFDTIRSLRPGRALSSALALAFTLALSSQGFAQGKGDVTVNLTAKKVVVTDGKESLESAGTAKPGDLIQYEAVYRNTTKTAVR